MGRSWLDNAMWLAGIVGQLILLFVIIRRTLYKSFPLFTSFIVLSTLSDSILLFTQATTYEYFVASFALKIPEVILETGVLIEIAANVVRPVRRSLPAGVLWFLAILILAGSLCGIALALHGTPHTLGLLSRSYLRVMLGMAVLRLLIFAAIAGFAQLLGIGWRNYVLQLATGFAFYGSVSIGVELYLFRFGTNANYLMFSRSEIASYVVTLVYWIWSFARQEAARKTFSPQMEKLLVSLSLSTRSTREALRSPGGRQ